jgi:hypothetical protein
VAVGVIHALEPVQVEEEDRNWSVRPAGAQCGMFDPLEQQQPVRKTGERVVSGDVA